MAGNGGGCDRRTLRRGKGGGAPPSGLAAAAGLHRERQRLPSGERRPAVAAARPSSSPLQRNWRSDGSCVIVCSSIPSR